MDKTVGSLKFVDKQNHPQKPMLLHHLTKTLTLPLHKPQQLIN